MATDAQRERAQLSDLLTTVGPDEPTLCGGWTTRDLAAHLVLRERRPDASGGIALGPLAGRTERVQAELAAGDYGSLVDQLREGPPWWSPFWLLDTPVNALELFVHHEDVRRAREGWEPRPLPARQQDGLFRRLRLVARLAYRASPVGVRLERPDGLAVDARSGPRTVTLVGKPGELLLHALGRSEVRLETHGAATDVETVEALDRGI